MPDRQLVRHFLLDLKEAIEVGGLALVLRKDTRATLERLEWTKRNLEEAVLALCVHDYCKRTEPDRDLPGEVWVFGYPVGAHEIYIKLKIFDAGGARMAKCISFHIAQWPMHYPFKGERR